MDYNTKYLKLFAGVILIFIIFYLIYNYYGPNDTFHNFPIEFMDNQDKELILYYSTGCGHCTAFMPEWLKFEEYAKQHINNLRVTKLNCEGGNKNVCIQKNVPGYPYVVLYKGNDEIVYDGDRTMESLIEFSQNN